MIILTSVAAMLVPTGTYHWLGICMFVFGGMMFSIYPLSVAHTNDHPEATDRVAVTSNLLLVYGIGAILGPVIGGILMGLFGPNSIFGLFIAGAGYLAYSAFYYRKHGQVIHERDKTHYVPYVRTSQVAIDLESKQNDSAEN